MKQDSRDQRFRGSKVRGSWVEVNPEPIGLWGCLLILMLFVIFSLAMGCQKKENAPQTTPAVEPKAMEQAPALTDEGKVPETTVQAQDPTFHSILTKDLNRPIPGNSFSKNDKIYLVTVWTGLQGQHEIKVLWIRPDKTVQETVRLKEIVPSNPPTYTSWAYLSFTKGLLNISPLEGKFIGAWKAQLFLDGKFLKGYDFTVF
jgi:hypothetical protein